MTAHRYFWTYYRGPIPDGLWVLHKCDTRCCVNPQHLYLGTVKENAADVTVRRRRTRVRLVTIDGETRSVTEFARRLGQRPKLVHGRMARGWSTEEALSLAPSKTQRRNRPGDTESDGAR